MASLLNNASLLLNPAGSIIAYEEDKILSVLPRNGAGDFTFSGGDGGTRVNQDGYIEQTPANFMLNSGTTWTPFNVTVTTGVTDPVGGTGAYTIGSIASGNITDYGNKGTNAMSLPAGTVITFSISMKGSGTIATYLERAIAGTYWFDVKTHTLSSEWQVFTHSYTVPTDASGVGVYVGNATGTTATSVDVAFPMVNYGSTAKPYQPTTDRLNYPRITYQNGRGALLSEPQRTNLTQGSNGLTTNWTNYRGTYTANAISSPDGTVNAPLTVWDGSSPNSVGFFFQNFSFVGSTAYCLSFFLKYYNKDIVNIGYADRSSPFLGGSVDFNIANGTVGSVYGDATKGIIEPYKDGWYRCTVVFTAAASPSFNYISVGADGVTTGQGFYVYGSQFEVGTFPTSYIPTTTATVTRPQDTTENSSASSVIGQTEGVLYTDFSWNILKGASDFLILTISDGTTTNDIFLDIYNDQVILGMDSGGRVVQITSSTITTGRHKIAGGYKNNDFVLYLDGKQIGTDSSGTVPACSVIDVGLWANGSYPFAGNFNTVGLFKSRLTNTQLAELTTVRSGSGGTISYYGPYTVHTFTGSATFTPSFNGQVEVLVVAGGGSGAAGWGNGGGMGGGGAGGLLYASSFGVSQGTGITVTIGAGGAGTTGTTQSGRNGTQRGNPGSNTTFGGLTALGGGGGAGDGATTATMTGGSGGGGGYASIGTGGIGTPGQGNNGGNHSNNNGFPGNYCGGGGGGAGAVGTPGTTAGGNGGVGLPYSISGFSTYYAGGGGGGTYASSGPGGAGIGGLGGGGNGGLGTTNPGQNGIAGVNFTGGAGGAGGCPSSSPNTGGNGGAGGNGIVIVRYLT
jgi:hypothetical protein